MIHSSTGKANIKTSATHPLEIDPLPCGSGTIGMTLCPGKQADSLFGGRWERDLAADIAAVSDWGATTLVTLMEVPELERLGVRKIGDVAEAAGLDWHLLPIVDVNVPDDRFVRRWSYSGHVLRGKLAAGERVVLHCRGGLGRTGTIAARLAIEFGAGPADAMKSVRRARSGTVETPAQEAYVLECTEYKADRAYADRVLGCLLGGAVGDAFGYAVEFDLSLSAIHAKFGPHNIREPVLNAAGESEVSDDTQMTLFTAAGLLECIQNGHMDQDAALSKVRLATLDWHAMQTGRTPSDRKRRTLANYSVLSKGQAPGNTCMSACTAGATGTPEHPINDSKGCGGVMRVAPVGLLSQLTSNEAFELAARCAAQTHGHPSGYLSAGVLAAMVNRLMKGLDLNAAISEAITIARIWPHADEVIEGVERALHLADNHGGDYHDAIMQLGEGWVGDEALAIGTYAALVGTDYRDAIRIAANHGGDSDSTASITGQVLGARNGLEGIPNAWIRSLDALDPLLEVADRLIQRSSTTGAS